MSRPTWLATTAGVAVASMLTAACLGGSGRTAPKRKASATTSTIAATPTRTVTIRPAGGGPVEVTIRPSIDGRLRVEFDPSAGSDTGAQWRAAGRNAVLVATLLTGVRLGNREIDFRATGPVAGPGASALMTIAVIALIRGDALAPGAPLTGVIGLDGGIGPVAAPGRVPAPSTAANVYDAYEQLTGQVLRRPPASANTRLAENAYSRIRARVASWTARYELARAGYERLPASVRQDLNAYATAARGDEQQATDLSARGLEAGAFAKAVNAAAIMDAIARVGDSYRILLAQGAPAFVARITAGRPIADRVSDLVDTLQSFVPRTVSDAGALIAAYSSAIDAVSLSQLARTLFDVQAASAQLVLADAAQGAIYYELAGSLLTAARDLLAVGREASGAALVGGVDTADVARFFRNAAEANLDAFRSLVVVPGARAEGVSVASAERAFALSNSQYALASTGATVVQSLPSYFGRGPATNYAELAGAISLYARTAELMSQYLSFGAVNPRTLALTGISDSGAFDSAILFAQSQTAANIGRLRAEKVSPVMVAAANEMASVDQNGSAADAFNALSDYWDAYLNGRVLAYLGGFATP